MLIPVLVATPHTAFGELLRLSLEESGRYRVSLVESGRKALAAAVDPVYRIAILDGDIADMSFRDLLDNLVKNFTRLKVTVIPPDNNSSHPVLTGIKIHGTISRPFYLPDLLALMDALSADGEIDSVTPPPGLPTWLTEKSLRSGLAVTTCQAGMLVTRRGEQVFSGIFEPSTILELTEIVQHYWQGDGKSDLVRYIRLPSTQTDHLLYVTAVMRLTALCLVYPVSTPLSRVRMQAGQVVRWLTSHNPNEPAALPPTAIPSPVLPAMPPTLPVVPASSNVPAVPAAPAAKAPPEVWDIPSAENGVENEEIRTINLAALLGNVPPPDPGLPADDASESAWVPEISMIFQRSETEPPVTWETTFPEVTPPAPAVVIPAPETPEQPAATRPLKLKNQPVEIADALDNELLQLDDEENDARPDVIASLTSIRQLDPTSAAFSLCNYSCVLVPRLPQHFLTGALADKLGQWVQQLCLAYEWRLEGIAVRPQYLQWMVQVAPNVAPSTLVKVMRQRTAVHIFEEFPNYARENPSGDFWATGYLIVSGTQPPSTKLLRDYIHETRSRQGISLPITEPVSRFASENTVRLQANTFPKKPAMD